MRKVQGLGGKFGEKLCEDLDIENMAQLGKFSKEDLRKRYDERNGYAFITEQAIIQLELTNFV